MYFKPSCVVFVSISMWINVCFYTAVIQVQPAACHNGITPERGQIFCGNMRVILYVLTHLCYIRISFCHVVLHSV